MLKFPWKMLKYVKICDFFFVVFFLPFMTTQWAVNSIAVSKNHHKKSYLSVSKKHKEQQKLGLRIKKITYSLIFTNYIAKLN